MVNRPGRPKAGVTFWDRVNSQIIAGLNNCNIFTGCKDDCGYGRINKEGKLVRLHREMWALHNGTIPPEMCVCHACDNPACINPNHLFLGTHQDNMTDKAKKGRVKDTKGQMNPAAKLTSQNVVEIRCLLKTGRTAYGIARDYGVSGECVLDIKHNRTWKSVK